MKITYVFVTILIIALLLAGCAPSETDVPRRLTNYVGGTDGLSFEFEEDAPPDTVMDAGEEDFSIALGIKNEGEYTIPKGKIIATLSGIDRESFSLPSLHKKSDFDIDRRLEEKAGGRGTIDFGMANYKIDLKSDFSTKIVADVCYDYRTVAAARICLKKNTIQHKTRDACAINQPMIDYENSGGPIQIKNVEESSSGSNRIRLAFKLSNDGQGYVYKPNTFTTKCAPDEYRKEEDYVYVKVSDDAGRLRFQCSGLDDKNAGVVRLYDNEREISCTLDTTGLQETAYESLINIEVDYMYRDAIEQPITIENAEVY